MSLFPMNKDELMKIIDQMRAEKELVNKRYQRQQSTNPPTQRPLEPSPRQHMVRCFHCGEQFDSLSEDSYEILKRHSKSNGKIGYSAVKRFHESCFKEVAGKGYIE